MADAWGIDDGYWDIDGHWHDAPETTRRAIRVAMGGHADVADPPPKSRPVWFVREGTAPPIDRPATLVLEDGTELLAGASLPDSLPLGYHDLHPSDGGATTRLIVAPRRCHLPAALRTWAWAVQLYATRSAASWGIGDLADLRRLTAWSASLGAGFVSIGPLHATLPIAPQEASPYFPSSRVFRSPLYLAVDQVPGFDPTDPALATAAQDGRALDGERVINRDRVLTLKLGALERLWTRFRSDPAFDRYRRDQGAPLRQFSTFNALAEEHGCPWPLWPAEHRRPESPGVERFAVAHAERVAFHSWLQWLVDEQLRLAAEPLPLLSDLAVGVDPGGADAWVWQDVFAHGARVGAPPDEFNTAGQDWGVPPFVPWKLRSAGYEPLVRTLRAAMRHAGALRVDHVMGLFRLFWIPPGLGPADGAYVRYPGSELLDILALESVRAGVMIVGEDLGTVEDDARQQLAGAGVLSSRLVWFEHETPDRYPEQAFAAVTTHDLPTIAGVWSGADLDAQRAAGLQPNVESTRELRTHLTAVAGVTPSAPVADVVLGAYRSLGAAPSMIVSAILEDPLGVEERPNLPGTTSERPNWSVALPVPLEEVEQDPLVLAVAAALAGRPPVDTQSPSAAQDPV